MIRSVGMLLPDRVEKNRGVRNVAPSCASESRTTDGSGVVPCQSCTSGAISMSMTDIPGRMMLDVLTVVAAGDLGPKSARRVLAITAAVSAGIPNSGASVCSSSVARMMVDESRRYFGSWNLMNERATGSPPTASTPTGGIDVGRTGERGG